MKYWTQPSGALKIFQILQKKYFRRQLTSSDSCRQSVWREYSTASWCRQRKWWSGLRYRRRSLRIPHTLEESLYESIQTIQENNLTVIASVGPTDSWRILAGLTRGFELVGIAFTSGWTSGVSSHCLEVKSELTDVV